jgi:predicted RNA methylase
MPFICGHELFENDIQQLMNNLMLQVLRQQLLEEMPYSWFPSSPLVADLIIKNAQIQSDHYCLDVCAGTGILAVKARETEATVHAIEINSTCQQILFQQVIELVGTDFMQTEPRRLYERIISNPPFSFSPQQRGVDLAIIQRAFQYFLAPGGRLISVVSASHKYARCPQAEAFRIWMKNVKAELIELPLEAFWKTERPVTVESWLLVVNK